MSKLIRTYDDLLDVIIGKYRETWFIDICDNDYILTIFEVTHHEQAGDTLNIDFIDVVASSVLVISYPLEKK